MRNRTVIGVENQCRYYVPPDGAVSLGAHLAPHLGPKPGYSLPRVGAEIHDQGAAYPGCHWYLEENRTTPWAQQTGLPGAGSEFSWDTTGQEEAFVWGTYFNATGLAASALGQILAYTPLVPNFAWHGSAFGMGDFSNNGHVARPNLRSAVSLRSMTCGNCRYRYLRFDGGHERVLQHYRSGLNSIPTTEAFLAEPSDLYLLRLAAGSIGGVLANIEVGTGAPSMGFHADPANLVYDAASGDWGCAFFGHTHNTGSFLVRHDDLGWLCYFCDADVRADAVQLAPRDSYRRRVFVAPLGLLLTSDAGRIAWVRCALDASGAITEVTVAFEPVGAQALSRFRLRLAARAGGRAFRLRGGYALVRGAYEIPASAQGANVSVAWA